VNDIATGVYFNADEPQVSFERKAFPIVEL
jgi:hypothetical protein